MWVMHPLRWRHWPKTNPDNADYADCAMVRGLIQQFSHEFEPALASLTKASELNPTSAEPPLWRSAIYMVQALIFSTESAEQTLALQPSSAWQTFSQHVVEGVWHIWTGFDHIFFTRAAAARCGHAASRPVGACTRPDGCGERSREGCHRLYAGAFHHADF